MTSFKSRNIKIAYILSFLSDLYFPISVWIFYYSRFLNFKQIAILTTIKVVASNFFEIPTSAFADIYGRKKSVIVSFVLFALAMFVFAYTFNFWIFVILNVFMGLSNSFYSGSLEALVYDTLKKEKSENEYDKVVSNMESMLWVGLFVSAIIGGFLYHFWFRFPYLLQGVVYLIAGILSLRLVEVKFSIDKISFKSVLRQNLTGFKEITKNISVTQSSFVFVVLGAGYCVAANILGISQMKEYGADSRMVGIIFGTGYIISAVVSQFYPKLRKKIGAKKLLIITALFLIGSFVLARFAGVIFGAILIIGRISSSTTFRNIRSSILNRHISSKNRATTISTVVLLSQLPYAIFAYFIGDYIDKYSPNSLALMLGIIIIVLLIGQSFVFKMAKKRKVFVG